MRLASAAAAQMITTAFEQVYGEGEGERYGMVMRRLQFMVGQLGTEPQVQW